jgi:hypothetical protein
MRITKCVNGCDTPPAPPSKVICKACQNEITRKIEAMIEKLDQRAETEQEEPLE